MLEQEAGFRRILAALDSLGVPHMVGGSLASAVHGIPRSTQDIDIVADLPLSRVREFSADLSAEFYADPEMIEEAVRRRRAFNLIHYASGYKFDIFPIPPDIYYPTQLERREVSARAPLEFTGGGFPVASAEDTILMKLVWYRQGGGVSERQWTDILGIVKIRRDKLDYPYLRRWAAHLRVEDLLDHLLDPPPQN